ncbi:methylthioribulose-1-phosphate dehydratase-like isoform X2 [Styela clava]|uniref:methylthioribulose-1-phosphate dehydratase-like isoform X2 n=1 Tax=Styela clava TaxID=7725 RepID=UPI00193A0295|nr:methylthioribulose-1-phosphate dehydratase-like isoform X2 [Styela clava]
MDALNYGAYIASQYGGERSSDMHSSSYNSPSHHVDVDERDVKKEKRPGKLVVRFPSHGSHQNRLDNNDTTPLSSPSPGPMSGLSENNMTMLCRSSSDSMELVPASKRRRGRPRKLNPDGSYATNHIPLSNSIQTQQYNRRLATDHPRNLIPELCRQMFKLGWMSGTGGSMTIRQNKQIFVTPSGVSKERILPQDLFVLDDHGNLLDCPIQEKRLKMTDNAVVFLSIYSMRNAGAIIHSHSPKAVMATLLFKDREFRISHQEMLKGMFKGNSGERYGNEETLVIPIIENLPSERDLQHRVTIAVQQYPMSNAVLIRRHGLYVWGDTWQSAKSQSECLDYLFELALEMQKYGLDPAAMPSGEHGIVD